MRSSRSTPTGPGSRGGHYHEREFRLAYHRAWRRAHPEYRERDLLRLRRGRHGDSAMPEARRLPMPAETCACECGCLEHVVLVCGFCRDDQHREE